MRRSRKISAGVVAVVVAAGGYAALDVYDKAPGVLTLADAPRPAVTAPGGRTPQPVARPAAPAAPAALGPADGAPAQAAKVSAAVRAQLTQKQLGATTAITVRDAATGAHLLDRDADGAHTPASVTKLLAAYAVAQTLDLDGTLDTRVVAGSGGQVVLVAGGDTAIAPGRGNPESIDGHAGMADLATQTARSLRAQGKTSVTVGYDLSYAPGPLTAKSWDLVNVQMGYTTRIGMLGLSTDRSHPGTPPPTDPARSATNAFVAALKAQGITASLGQQTTAAAGAAQLGVVHSAPVVDVLGMALQDSDNAMIESLARQGAAKDGHPGDTASVTAWIRSVLTGDGINLAGVTLADASGLGSGTTIPVRVFGDLVTRATTGQDPQFRDVLARLPVAGWNGTLDDRFQATGGMAGAGEVRAKTGSLPSVSSLVGTVLDRDHRLLVFAVVNNGAQSQGPYATRAALDRIVAALATCSCGAGPTAPAPG